MSCCAVQTCTARLVLGTSKHSFEAGSFIGMTGNVFQKHFCAEKFLYWWKFWLDFLIACRRDRFVVYLEFW